MFKRKRYRDGIKRANQIIDSLIRRYGKQGSLKEASYQHDRFDVDQFKALEKGDKIADYYRGLAMGLGMYSTTGKKLCK